MQLDETLLKVDGVPADDDLKAFFNAHDFSTAAPLIDRENITKEQAELCDRVRKLFQTEWLKQTKALGGKELFVNFTNNYQLKKLADTDANLISDAILKIAGDDELLDALSESACQISEEPLTEAVFAYAEKTGKDIHVMYDAFVRTLTSNGYKTDGYEILDDETIVEFYINSTGETVYYSEHYDRYEYADVVLISFCL